MDGASSLMLFKLNSIKLINDKSKPSPSPHHQIIFNFSFTYEYLNWIQDKDSICLVQQDDSNKFIKTSAATIEEFSLQAITEPIEKLLKSLSLSEADLKRLIDYVWTIMDDCKAELTEDKDEVVDIDIGVFVQCQLLTDGENKDLIKDGSCSICLDDLSGDKFLLGLPCRHVFHQDCMMKWSEAKGIGSCPFCRRNMSALEEYLEEETEFEEDDQLLLLSSLSLT